MGRKYTYEEVKEYIDFYGCELIEKNYMGIKNKMNMKCKCGALFVTSFNEFKNMGKKQCTPCGRKNASEKMTKSYEDVKTHIESNSNCKLISKEYIHKKSELDLKCLCGNIFKTSLDGFNKGKKNCSKCVSLRLKEKTYNKVKKYIEIESNSGCKLISEKYNTVKSMLKIQCSCGKIFEQTFDTFKKSTMKCKECVKKYIGNKNKMDNDTMLEYVHNNSFCKFIECDSYEEKKDNTRLMKLRCQCGEIFYIRFSHFKNTYNKMCNKCSNKQVSKGERKILEYLKRNNILTEYQKKYNNLVGFSGKCLSYDFYLADYNLLIEYQGEYHDRPVIYNCTKDEAVSKFKLQKEYDKRKKEYAKQNNIKLLEIWYWDFDNIDQILDKELLNK